MSRLTDRWTNWLRAGVTLVKAGATLTSILLFPIRRRLFHRRSQIDLKNGISLLAPANEPLLQMFEEIWIKRCYTPENCRIPFGHAVVDVGANVGVFSIWVAVNHPDAKVIALEPTPRICDYIRRNISKNNLQNISVVECACGGERGEALLYCRGPEAMNSLYSRDLYGSLFHPLGRVRVLTLDDVFAQFDVQVCGLLKLDCEGAEYDVLFQARETTLQRVERIAMEYHVGLNEHTPEELVCFLESKGFRVEKLPMIDEEGGYLYARRKH